MMWTLNKALDLYVRDFMHYAHMKKSHLASKAVDLFE